MPLIQLPSFLSQQRKLRTTLELIQAPLLVLVKETLQTIVKCCINRRNKVLVAVNYVKIRTKSRIPTKTVSDDVNICNKFLTPKFHIYNLDLL